MSSNVVKTVGLSSKVSTRKRKHSSSDEEDSRTSHLHSIVKVKERKYVDINFVTVYMYVRVSSSLRVHSFGAILSILIPV